MKRLFNIIILFTLSIACYTSQVSAQSTDRDYIRLGNKQFRKAVKDNDAGNFTKALTNYTKALEKKKTPEAFYNFGCAAMVQQQDSSANRAFMMADSLGFTNQLKRAKNFHNMGNLWYMYGVQQIRSNGQDAGKAFQNAVNLYKSSLRCNPKDDETRYNLAMAMFQLKKNQNNGGGGGNNSKNKDQNKDKNKDQQKKQDQQKQQQKQDQQKQDQQQQQQQQQKKDQMSDQAAEQLLNSAQQDEKSVQQKVKATPQRRRSLEKDW